MQIDYMQLREFLDTLTPQQLAQPVRVYAADVDDVMDVFSLCENTEEVMGAPMEGYETNQIFLQI